jgi:hypothetical protein
LCPVADFSCVEFWSAVQRGVQEGQAGS